MLFQIKVPTAPIPNKALPTNRNLKSLLLVDKANKIRPIKESVEKKTIDR